MGVSTPPSDEENRVAHRENLIEQMTERGNLKAAWKKVRRNDGSAGIASAATRTTVILTHTKYRQRLKDLFYFIYGTS
jgi:hypothetical protein